MLLPYTRRHSSPSFTTAPYRALPVLTTLKSIASLLLSFGLLLMANGLFATLLGVRSSLEGFSTFLVGLVMSGYFIGLLVGGRFAVKVVASVGHIRAFAAFASVMSATALVHVLWIDPVVWFVLRTIAGFCMAGMIMVSESWINERASNQMRGQVLSFYMITSYFAAGCGQFLLPLADPSQFHLFSVASIIFSLALVPVLLTRAQAPMPASSHSMKMLYHTSPLGFIGVFCAGLVNASFHGMGAVFGHEIGLSTQQISLFMASAIFGGLILQWPMGRLSDRIDRRWVLIGVALVTCAACLSIMAFAGARNTVDLYGVAAIYGSVSFTIYSVAAAHINDFADREQLVQVASGLLITYGIGASVGPTLSSVFMSQLGPNALFLYSAIISGMLGLFALHRMRRRATKRIEERTRFVVVPTGYSDALRVATEQIDRDRASAARLS